MPGAYSLDLYFRDGPQDVDIVHNATPVEVLPADVFGTDLLPPRAAAAYIGPPRSLWVRLAKESMYLAYRYSTPKVIGSFFRDMEGDDQVTEIDLRIGRLLGLMELRSRYRQIRCDVAEARWRRVDSVNDSALGVDRLKADLSRP